MSYSNTRNPQTQELVETTFASIWDPNPIVFKSIHKKESQPFIRLLKDQSRNLHFISGRLLRNSFLYGCLKYTEKKPIEHMIIGYGKKMGRGTIIKVFMHFIGDEDSVSIPDSIYALMRFVSFFPTMECIVFHNHPYKRLISFSNGKPLPSSPDREIMLRNRYLEPYQILRRLMGAKGGIRFYLGEQGKVREILIPNILGLFR